MFLRRGQGCANRRSRPAVAGRASLSSCASVRHASAMAADVVALVCTLQTSIRSPAMGTPASCRWQACQSLATPRPSRQLSCAAQDGRKPRGRGGGNAGPSCRPSGRAREQVAFSAPLADDALVAIIGGGLSGLVCAGELAQRGIRSVVFDTGARRRRRRSRGEAERTCGPRHAARLRRSHTAWDTLRRCHLLLLPGCRRAWCGRAARHPPGGGRLTQGRRPRLGARVRPRGAVLHCSRPGLHQDGRALGGRWSVGQHLPAPTLRSTLGAWATGPGPAAHSPHRPAHGPAAPTARPQGPCVSGWAPWARSRPGILRRSRPGRSHATLPRTACGPLRST
jgi:hypothetical protein